MKKWVNYFVYNQKVDFERIKKRIITEAGKSGKLLKVVSAKYLNDYKIKIKFSDGKEKVVDFKSFLELSNHPDIKKYLEVDLFKSYNIVHGNLIWNDYDMIFPVADLYQGKLLSETTETKNLTD